MSTVIRNCTNIYCTLQETEKTPKVTVWNEIHWRKSFTDMFYKVRFLFRWQPYHGPAGGLPNGANFYDILNIRKSWKEHACSNTFQT